MPNSPKLPEEDLEVDQSSSLGLNSHDAEDGSDGEPPIHTQGETPVESSGAPDGGWGWMVVLGCILGHFLIVGVARAFGVLFVALLVRYERSAAETAWVHSLYNTIRMVSGPLVSRLCNRFTYRKVVILGGLIQCVGFVSSAFADSLWFLYLSYGGIAGLGGGLIFTPMLIAISEYFEKKKGKAMALATFGSGLGSFVLAPLVTFLLAEYSWPGTMLILGGMMLNSCVVGALLRPLPKPQKVNNTDSLMGLHGPEYQKDTNLTCSERCTTKCRKSPTLKLIRDPIYLFYSLAIVAMPFTGQLTLLMVPAFAKELGMSNTEAALILSTMGISDMCGRFAFGALFDLAFLKGNRTIAYCLLGIALGLITISIGLQRTFVGFIILSVFFGLIGSGLNGQRVTIQSEFIPKSQIANAVGNMIFCQGIGNLLGPFTGGLLADSFGSYGAAVIYAGIVMFLASAIFLVTIIITRTTRGKGRKSTTCTE